MAANIKFVNSRFKDAILGHGFQVMYEKHQTCSCYNSETSEADPNCPYCGGLHFIWRPYGVIPALLVGVKEIRRQIVDFTKVSEGDVAITTLPQHKLAINDRIRMVHSKEIYSETIDATYNDSGEKVFIPFYDIAEFESVIADGNIDIPLTEVYYDQSKDEIHLINSQATKISVRYVHYPFYLISELLHSNRQQWSGDVGQGNLENLPNQYLGKRITTKLKTAYRHQLIESDVVIDLANQIQEQSPAYTHEFQYLEPYKYAPLQEIEDQYFNLFSRNVKGYFALEMYFVQSPTGHIFTISDEVVREMQIASRIKSINDVLRFAEYVQPGMIFLLTRDKYAKDFTLYEFRDGSYLTYNGGPLEDSSSWTETSPQDKDLAVSEFDFVENPDCEIPIYIQNEFVFSEDGYEWHKKEPDIVFSLENQRLKISAGDQEIITDYVLSKDKNCLTLNLQNKGALKLSSGLLNGNKINITLTTEVNGLGHNKQISILDENGSMILFRIYSRALDNFEQLQNMNFLQNN